MDWRQYEAEIYQKLKSDFPEVNITFDGRSWVIKVKSKDK